MANVVDTFGFQSGKVIARNYEIVSKIGSGWEGEVYLIREAQTGIERAAKFFYPHRNLKDKTAIRYAKKLHYLHHCPIVIGYYAKEFISFRRQKVSFLISEYVEGEPLSGYLKRQPGRRLTLFKALHLLYALVSGMETIHQLKEYHGDLHMENIMIQPYGLGFKLKLMDFFHWTTPRRENIQDDLCDMIHIFFEILGGYQWYSKLPQEAKTICCGLKKSLILKKFRSAGHLKKHLETLTWS